MKSIDNNIFKMCQQKCITVEILILLFINMYLAKMTLYKILRRK